MQTSAPQPRQPAVILADHLQLVLVARKANPAVRWAAVANHHYSTRSCTWRWSAGAQYPRPPMLTPMERGNLHRAIERMRLTQGLASIRATFGAGLRAVLAEPAHVVPAEFAQ